MIRPALLALALAASLLPLAAGADHIQPPPEDLGGSVLERAMSLSSAEGPIVLTGHCDSACTMGLGAPGACVHLPARFGFHALRRDYTGLAQRIYDRYLWQASPELLAWYRANAAHSDETIHLTGREMIRRGWARECPRRRD